MKVLLIYLLGVDGRCMRECASSNKSVDLAACGQPKYFQCPLNVHTCGHGSPQQPELSHEIRTPRLKTIRSTSRVLEGIGHTG